jgi:hypothetical protein
MRTTYRTEAPPRYRPKHRRPLSKEAAGLAGAALIWVVGTIAGIVMTAVA